MRLLRRCIHSLGRIRTTFDDTIQFLIAVQDVGRTTRPKIHDNAYKDLISTGNSALILDKNVLNMLLSYYNNIPNEWYDEYIDRMWKGYLPLAVEALDLGTHEQILNYAFIGEFDIEKYHIEVSSMDAQKMLYRIKKMEAMKFESKNIARTHLVHQYFLNNSKNDATEVLQALEAYLGTLSP